MAAQIISDASRPSSCTMISLNPRARREVVLVAVQDAAIAFGIESQAITANTFSEQLAVGIRAATDSALLEAVDLTL